ncbi:MAG: TIGR03620 family F420-dependent LLM class oxidoreductase [Actinophytocola sp.]|uniref:LLM class F420-dependent oxidoreductase n=1 Tax=Actinophytocola sp. TaxID=1872138 RepID=UPI001327E7C7|nr:LLM class F420-dependent oxidoreductase [Actinophytocola sp.]MPZ79947.1 TIGR03620 family F420-dependent LLM class oxidoreductase [Actinophytocola sp.]
MDIGRLGLWQGGTWAEFRKPEVLAELEELGIGAVWLGGSPPADLKIPERLLSTSSKLVVATGIVNVWDAPPEVAAASYARLSAYSDRLILGIGAGHRSMVGDAYTKPYEKLVSYLDGLDAGGVPVAGRALAALGPKVLRLAADRTAGAHPYLVTPEHTAQAREILGSDTLLMPEQKVVLSTDPDTARALARKRLHTYLTLPNYTNNWLRLGFTDDDLAGGGSDRLVDSMVAWGDEDAIRTRIEAHRAAGADHVALQVLNRDKLGALRKLAPALT